MFASPPDVALKLGGRSADHRSIMWIAGIVLLLVAAGAAWYARSRRAHAREATTTETLTAAELNELAKGVAGEVGGGSFHQRCEVVGAAAAGPAGAQKAPHSGTEAVWYRAEVVHRYWVEERRTVNNQTRWERSEREETVSDITSQQPFLVKDPQGAASVLVAPEGADIDRPEQTVDRFEQGRAQKGNGSSGVLDAVVNAFLDTERSGTLGFNYREWVIRPNARLYIHGEAADDTGVLRFAKPDKGRYVISTRSEEQIVGEATKHAKWATIGAAVAAVVGVVLVVAGIAAGV
jgi:hypothetical protein